MRMGAIDAETKTYLSDRKRFADAFNFSVYGGDEVIQADDLKELDTAAIALPYGADAKAAVQKYRDLLKLYTAMQDERAIYLVLGLEVQALVHYAMPVRGMLYDALNYARQVTEAAASYRKERKDEDTTAKTGLTQEEYLSGFRKEEGESVNMWAAWENGINQARNDGYADGESKGWDSAMVSNIKNLMETSGWDARQTMDALKIPASEQEKYAKQL